jgi:hypothetical protein
MLMPARRLKHLHRQVVLAAVAARGVGKRRVRLLRVFDEFREGAHRQRRVDGQHELVRRHRYHRREIAQGIDRHLVEMRIDGDLAVGEQAERVAVRLRARDELVGDVAVGARLVSTTTGWPMLCDSLSAITRAAMSGAPPGGMGTMMVIGRAGNCAKAAVENAARKTSARSFMSSSESW